MRCFQICSLWRMPKVPQLWQHPSVPTSSQFQDMRLEIGNILFFNRIISLLFYKIIIKIFITGMTTWCARLNRVCIKQVDSLVQHPLPTIIISYIVCRTPFLKYKNTSMNMINSDTSFNKSWPWFLAKVVKE